MTQAHKTPGALVEFKPTQDPNDWAVFGRWMGRVLEVVGEYPRGHIIVVDYETRQRLGPPPPPGYPECGFHEERFQTISPEQARKLRKSPRP